DLGVFVECVLKEQIVAVVPGADRLLGFTRAMRTAESVDGLDDLVGVVHAFDVHVWNRAAGHAKVVVVDDKFCPGSPGRLLRGIRKGWRGFLCGQDKWHDNKQSDREFPMGVHRQKSNATVWR